MKNKFENFLKMGNILTDDDLIKLSGGTNPIENTCVNAWDPGLVPWLDPPSHNFSYESKELAIIWKDFMDLTGHYTNWCSIA